MRGLHYSPEIYGKQIKFRVHPQATLEQLLDDPYIQSVVETAVYFANRGNIELLNTSLSWWGVESNAKVKELIEKYDIAPFEWYKSIYEEVIKEKNLPFKVKQTEKGWRLVYSGNNLDEDLDEFSEGVLERNPNALYGLREPSEEGITTVDNGLVIDENGNPLYPNTNEPLSPEKPSKWKKIFAIGAAATLGIGVGIYAFTHFSSDVIKKAKISIEPDGEPHNNEYITDWKMINMDLVLSKDVKEVKIFYGCDFVNSPVCTLDSYPHNGDNYEVEEWLFYKSFKIPSTGNHSLAGGWISVGKDIVKIHYKNNADMIGATAVVRDKHIPVTLIKINAYGNGGKLLSSKRIWVQNYDIPPKIKSIDFDGENFTMVIEDLDNMDNFLWWVYWSDIFEKRTGSAYFKELNKIDNYTWIGKGSISILPLADRENLYIENLRVVDGVDIDNHGMLEKEE